MNIIPAYTIEKLFEASIIFEASIAVNGWSYLIIYGKHINGYFCSIPSHNFGCELSEPNSISYNTSKLEGCGVDEEVAEAIANAISEISQII